MTGCSAWHPRDSISLAGPCHQPCYNSCLEYWPSTDIFVSVEQENIITMVQDDLAKNFMNPHPGKMYNRPGGPDVYEDVKLVST